MVQEGLLNDAWVLWMRDPNNKTDWSLQSFHELGRISTIRDFKIFWEAIKDKMMHGIFFIMREHINPTYEDPSNSDGMGITMKFPENKLHDVWLYLVYRILGETLVKTNDPLQNENINGIQIIPKRKQGFTVKIWIGDKELANPTHLHLRKDMIENIIKYDDFSKKN
jgi:hypothetical protein